MMPVRWTMLGAAAALLAAGCGSGEDDQEPARAIAPPKDIVGSLPDPFDPAARPAPGTYAGRIGDAGRTYIGVVLRGERAVVYLCDGRAAEWFGARVRDGRLFVRSARGTIVDARVTDGAMRGSVRVERQPAGRFVAPTTRAAGTGVLAGPDPAVPGGTRRWIVLADGVRGVSETTASTTDGSSNTLLLTETTDTTPPPRSTTTATTPAAITDGSSNTLQLGETTATQTAPPARTTPATTTTTSTTENDGSSNTLQLGETTATQTTPPARTTTTTSTTENDGSSNTLQLGETTATQTTPPSPTTSTTASTPTDGSSNTVLVGETPVNGVVAGRGAADPAAPPATTCPANGCGPVLTGFSLTDAVKPVAVADDAPRLSVAGGSLLSCTALARLARTLVVPASTGDTTARAQLRSILSQAKAKRC